MVNSDGGEIQLLIKQRLALLKVSLKDTQLDMGASFLKQSHRSKPSKA